MDDSDEDTIKKKDTIGGDLHSKDADDMYIIPQENYQTMRIENYMSLLR